MGTGIPLGGRGEAPPTAPMPGPCGGKGLEGEGAPTFGGLAGTAGLGLTSGGTMSDMSAGEQKSTNEILKSTECVTTSLSSRTGELGSGAVLKGLC